MRKPYLFLWGLMGLILVFFWIYLPVLTKYRELKMEEDRITRELSELNRKVEELSEERDLLKSDVSYLEKIIRDEMGLVKPGEAVYKFVSEKAPETPSAAPADLMSQAAEGVPAPSSTGP